MLHSFSLYVAAKLLVIGHVHSFVILLLLHIVYHAAGCIGGGQARSFVRAAQRY